MTCLYFFLLCVVFGPFFPQNLLRRLLEKDPEHRIELNEAIQHPWVTKEGSMPLDGLDPLDDSSGNDLELLVEVCLLNAIFCLLSSLVLFSFSCSEKSKNVQI